MKLPILVGPPESWRIIVVGAEDVSQHLRKAGHRVLSLEQLPVLGLRSADAAVVEETRAASRETGKMFASEGIKTAAARYADGPTRQAHKNKDPRGYAQFVQMLSEHSSQGHSLTMINLQAKRPTLWDMEANLKRFSIPLLIVVGDEDDWCVDASIFLRRTVPTAGLLVVPRTGHTLTSEEPDKFNAALAELFADAEAGRWLAHKPH